MKKVFLSTMLCGALAASVMPVTVLAQGGVTLNVTTTFAGNESNVELYQETLKSWEEETGNHADDASASSDETFKARVISDFETGAEPDVLFYFNGNDANPFVEAGKVVSIAEIREAYPDYASNMKDDMIPPSPADGVQYAVPFYGYWEGMFCNKVVLESAGVEIPDGDTTWEEFLTDCQTIKDAGFTPIAVSLAKEPHYWFEFAIYNQGTPKTHATVPEAVDDEAGLAWQAGIEDIQELYDKGFLSENTNTATADEVFQSFLEGKSAFYLDGSWKMGGIKDGTEDVDNFTVTYVPGKGDRKATDIIGGLSSGWYISRKCWEDEEKRDAAVSLVEKFISDETVSQFAGTATTALKNGVEIDESSLTSLEKDSLAMIKGTTGITGAVQDFVTPDERAPIFDNMPQIMEGKTEISDALGQVLEIIEENAE
ncbi:MAG: extracellular solute-binding protein [Eubacteriales bacterium]|nr:extracellular solute-binding protein [Eubacteriales bacterium]